MRSAVVSRNLITFLIGLLAFYAIILIIAYLMQDRMLYFPSRATRRETVEAAAQRGLVLWPDGTDDYHGLVSTSPPAVHRGTVLVWHGNAGSALHRTHYVPALQRLGFRVILVEYPGYGARSGDVGEASFVRDARQAARLAKQAFGGPLYVWGESLGCGVASAVAAASVAADSELEVQGAVMLTPWDSLPSLAQRLYWYLPIRWFVRDKYDNVGNLQSFDGPVAVLMAEWDEVIPNKHTQRLYESLPGPKRLWVFENAGHNTWPTSPEAEWWAEVMEYVTRPHTDSPRFLPFHVHTPSSHVRAFVVRLNADPEHPAQFQNAPGHKPSTSDDSAENQERIKNKVRSRQDPLPGLFQLSGLALYPVAVGAGRAGLHAPGRRAVPLQPDRARAGS